MKFAALLTGAAMAFANFVVADTDEFTMLTIHSTSKVHYSYIVNENGKLYVEPYTNTTDVGPSIITDGGKLKFGDKYMILQDDGTFKLGTEGDATDAFGIQGGHVVLRCKNNFSAQPEGDKYVLTVKGSNDAIGIALRATSTKGSSLDDFNIDSCTGPSPSGSSSAPAPSSSASAPSSSASAPSSSASAPSSSASSTVENIPAQTGGGVKLSSVGLGAGAVAAAVAALL